MNEIQTTKEEVYKILKSNEATRASDMKLYLEYCKAHWIKDFDLYKVFDDASYRKAKHVSPFETVSRCRRELQNDFIELNTDEKVQQMREAREEIFNNYFGGGRIR